MNQLMNSTSLPFRIYIYVVKSVLQICMCENFLQSVFVPEEMCSFFFMYKRSLGCVENSGITLIPHLSP